MAEWAGTRWCAVTRPGGGTYADLGGEAKAEGTGGLAETTPGDPTLTTEPTLPLTRRRVGNWPSEPVDPVDDDDDSFECVRTMGTGTGAVVVGGGEGDLRGNETTSVLFTLISFKRSWTPSNLGAGEPEGEEPQGHATPLRGRGVSVGSIALLRLTIELDKAENGGLVPISVAENRVA